MSHPVRSNLDLFRLAFRNVGRRPVRSLLTVVGIAAGMTAMAALLAVSGGIEQALADQLGRLGHDVILILPVATGVRPQSDEVFQVNLSDLDEMTGVKQSGGVLRKTLPVSSDQAQGFILLFGLSATTFEMADRFFQNFRLAAGSLPSAEPNSVLITERTSTDLKVRPDDSIRIGGEPFAISGLLKPSGMQELDNAIFLQLEDLMRLSNADLSVSFAWVQTDPDAGLAHVESQLRSYFAATGQSVNVQSPARINEIVQKILALVTAALGAMAAVAILVGSLALANTMFMSVLERTREIGVLVALGARPSQIITIFLAEASVIALAGVVVGLVFGMALAASIMLLIAPAIGISGLAPALSLEALTKLIVLAIGLAICAGLLPAMRAARVTPCQALRYE